MNSIPTVTAACFCLDLSPTRRSHQAALSPRLRRVMIDERKALIRNLIAAAVLAAWALGTAATSFTQPLLASTGLAIAGHYVKQCSIYPTGGRSSTPEEKKNVSKNLFRSLGLALFGMFMGMFLSFTAPDLISAQMGKTMPFWFYESQVLASSPLSNPSFLHVASSVPLTQLPLSQLQNTIINMGGIIMNTILVSFFR